MKLRIVFFSGILLILTASADAQLVGNRCAAKCSTVEESVQALSGKTYVISKSDKIGFENKIRELTKVSIDDIQGKTNFHVDNAFKINMRDRKVFFTDKGWQDYQQFVSKMKAGIAHKNASKKESNIRTVYASVFLGTQHYSGWYDDNLGFAAIGYLNYNDPDVVEPGSSMVEFNIAFAPQKLGQPEQILINRWRIKVFDFSRELSNWP